MPQPIHSHSRRDSCGAPQVDGEATIPYTISPHYLFRTSLIKRWEATWLMSFESLDEIRHHGFQGFKSVASLQASACREVSADQGVYLVLRPDSAAPMFLAQSIGGHFKGKDPTVAEETLRRKWIDETVVVYIGKAGRADGTATLRSRLLAYMQFGQGKPIGHWGDDTSGNWRAQANYWCAGSQRQTRPPQQWKARSSRSLRLCMASVRLPTYVTEGASTHIVRCAHE